MTRRYTAGAGLFATTAVLLALALDAEAQTGQRPSEVRPVEPVIDEEGYEVEELVVTAGRAAPRGSVVGDAEPEITLDAREVRALGVGSVTELLAALEPQLASGRGRGGGRPIILVNGQRISGFSEIRDLPSEAIQRVEILPEEVALRYGYRADQRVMNLVLRRRFRATTVEAGVRAPTAGGRSAAELDVNLLRIERDTRLQIDVQGNRATPLFESERDIVRTPDIGTFRTLLPRTEALALNTVLARPLGEGVAATINGRLEFTASDGRLGPQGAPLLATGDRDSLRRLNDTSEAHLGLAVNGARSGWRWAFTGNADRTETRTLTETAFDPVALAWRTPNAARSTVTSADGELLANGTLLTLPAGPVNAALMVGADALRFESESFRSGLRRDAELDRSSARARVNLDVPLANRRRGGFEGLGDLSVNVNAEAQKLSDFGTLTTLGGGVTWSPVEPLRIIASITEEEGAPSLQQLGNPELVTQGVRVFDFRRGETVEVTQISGGNRNLSADRRRVAKLGLTFKPFDETDFVIRADYTRSRLKNEISAFPAATSEIERAFPERFVRDATGRLVQVDVRPVNFARRDREELRWGFNYSRPLRNTRPPPWAPQRPSATGGAPAPEAPTPPGPPPAEGPPAGAREGGGPGGFGGGGRRGFGGRGGFAGGNLQLAVFHTWRLEEEVVIRPGLAPLDLLGGSTLGENGVVPRHQVDVQAGAARNGLGVRLNARWQEGGSVSGGAAGQGLDFSDLTTVDLRFFADLGLQPMARNNPWMRGARVTLSIDNLFDEKRRVRDAGGNAPLNYQPDLIDPLGRTVRVTFRKLFLPDPRTFFREGREGRPRREP